MYFLTKVNYLDQYDVFCHVLGKPDYTIVFYGMPGTGKSTAGNFFCDENVFKCGRSFRNVTTKCSEATSTICGKTVKIIDTPLFVDKLYESFMMTIKEARTLANDEIHAIALVIDCRMRYTSIHHEVFQLLCFEPLRPFLFLLLTHAEDTGITKAETDEYIQSSISSSDFPSDYIYNIQQIDNRVIMVESHNTAEDYRALKCKEFIEMIEHIHKSNGYAILSSKPKSSKPKISNPNESKSGWFFHLYKWFTGQ